MARRYPNRPRKRKGRPPPHRFQVPRINGFTSSGFKSLYDAILPDIRGSDRRRYFNETGDLIALIAGLSCGGLGLTSAGFFGAIIGFGVGYMVTNALLVSGRFIRR